MQTIFTVYNCDERGENSLRLGEGNALLAYLRPVVDNTKLISCAWVSATPQAGGSYKLPAINNDISAVATVGNYTTAVQDIPLQSMACITGDGEGNVRLSPSEVDNCLDPRLCYIENKSPCKDVRAVWMLNNRSVCKSIDPMFNGETQSFQLYQKLYLTVGGKQEESNFKVQHWTKFYEFIIPNGLTSADIHVWLDQATRKPMYKIVNQKY